MSRTSICFLLLLASLVVLCALSLFVGSASIPAADVLSILLGTPSDNSAWQFIVLSSRLPAMLTALLCGAALAVSGLLLQTAFRNPLAGPGIFGITNGAALGVALVMLLLGGSVMSAVASLPGFLAVLLSAFLGAMLVTLLLLVFSAWVRSNVMLLIVGIMVGYLSSSAIALLNFAATEEGVRSYMVWGLGSFEGVPMSLMPLFSATVVLSLAAAIVLAKPLNALLLGERYADSLGIATRRVRSELLFVSGMLAAVATAFCGPIAFIGLAVPHVARLLLGTQNHRQLLPATLLVGALTAVACHVASGLMGRLGSAVPINALTPLVGAPVIIYVILEGK